jgi:hypothetical protein
MIPASARAKTVHALDRAAIVITFPSIWLHKNDLCTMKSQKLRNFRLPQQKFVER